MTLIRIPRIYTNFKFPVNRIVLYYFVEQIANDGLLTTAVLNLSLTKEFLFIVFSIHLGYNAGSCPLILGKRSPLYL